MKIEGQNVLLINKLYNFSQKYNKYCSLYFYTKTTNEKDNKISFKSNCRSKINLIFYCLFHYSNIHDTLTLIPTILDNDI